MEDVAKNIRELKAELSEDICLVAVSKFHPATVIREAYDAGQRVFGESRVQELLAKRDQLPPDIQWHFIGHLQSNKVKSIAPFIDLIHCIDSFKLLQEVNTHAQNNNRIIPVLLQIHIAEEETKFGLSFDECMKMLSINDWKALTHIQIAGVMGMATFTGNTAQLHKEFESLRLFFRELRDTFFFYTNDFRILSMGMSDDYPIALLEGSNMIRVGSKIFGARL